MLNAYDVLIAGNLELKSDEDAEFQVRSLQRRFSLTDDEIKMVGYQAVLDIIKRWKEKIVKETEEKTESQVYKISLRAGVEARIIPMELKARIKKVLGR